MKIALVFPRARYPSGQPPLGILSLAAYVRQTVPATEIDVIDLTFSPRPLEMLHQRITAGNYDLVGVSVMTPMLKEAIYASQVARQAPSQPLVLWQLSHVVGKAPAT